MRMTDNTQTKSEPPIISQAELAKLAGSPDLVEAANALLDKNIERAEKLCRKVLKADPLNVNAMCLLANIGTRLGQYKDAAHLLERCLQLAPDFHTARLHYANALSKQRKYQNALVEIKRVGHPVCESFMAVTLRANILSQLGDHEEAVRLYQTLTHNKQYPPPPRVFVSLAHGLKTLGKQDEAVTAYRQALIGDPLLGEAYWSLANLKTVTFTAKDIKAMRKAAADKHITREDFFHLSFALGKALEDKGEYEESFLHYKRGNMIKKRLIKYNRNRHYKDAQRLKAFFTPALFKEKAKQGNMAKDPIFILGLPRAGSTLLEQILASHSQIDGTHELSEIISIARRLGGKKSAPEKTQYPHILNQFEPQQLADLGAEYIERTKVYRAGAPYFIDKMPNNFSHIGLIHLILPNAKIIDARRNPMDCCFSVFKQLFARGQHFSYSLQDIAHYYKNYVDLMRHWQKTLPNRILLVCHEDVLFDTETQIKRLLDFCNLPFEESCVRFYETKRAVRTASSEQVRQPINTKGFETWRNFENHLAPVQAILGDLQTDYKW